MKLKKENIAMILVLVIALVLRFWRLDLNPVGLVYDEIHQLVNAKSLALVGTGAAGTGAGIFQNQPYCDANCIFGDLPTFLLVPFAFFKTSFPSLKIPLILVSVLMIFWFIKVFENLTKNKWIGVMTGLMIAINPWAINFGRTAYENVFSFMFYAWSLYLLTKNTFKLKNQILAVFLGFVASMCYFGAKPIFIPLMLVGLVYGFWMERKNIKKYMILGLLAIILMAGYVLILKNSYAGNRLRETGLINSKIIQQVEEERRMALQIPILKNVFINKYTVLTKILLKKYLAGLAPNYLFNEGEIGFDHFAIADHAFMYLIDLPMIILGFYALALISVPAVLFVLITIFILPITSMLTTFGTTYALRNGLIYPILASMAGLGIYFLIKNIKNKKWKIFTGIILIFIYLISLTNFLMMYWYRNPFEKNAGWNFFERQAVKYVELAREINKEVQVEIIMPDQVGMIYEYAVFSGKINDKNFIIEMNEAIKNKSYKVDGIKFLKDCPKMIEGDKVYLITSSMACIANESNLVKISEIRDSAPRWIIPNDIVCNEVRLPKYPYPTKIEEFKIENISAKTFCKTWVNK